VGPLTTHTQATIKNRFWQIPLLFRQNKQAYTHDSLQNATGSGKFYMILHLCLVFFSLWKHDKPVSIQELPHEIFLSLCLEVWISLTDVV
jgi:hypothetical protein